MKQITLLILFAANASFAQSPQTTSPESTPWHPTWEPPSLITSPDGQYSVRMLDKQLSTTPGSAPYDYDRTLAVFHLDRSLSEFPTFGFLSEVQWSPDNKFVAVSNRRANSGDYLWVFSLPDGKPVKVPEDQDDDAKVVSAVGDVEARVRRKYPEYSGREIDRYFIAPDGWRSATELKVEIRVRFYHSPVVTIHDVYRVSATHIVRIQEKFVQSAR